MFGRHHSEETKKKMSEWQIGKPKSVETRKKMVGSNHPMFGKHLSEAHKKKLSEANLRKPKSAETRKNMRMAAIARIERNSGQVSPNYNPMACKIIDIYGKQHGYSFQHAENGGEYHIKELGYWVDGYDKEKNVVIEVYEPWHSKTKDRDEKRQQEITNHLGCEFIVI